MCENNEGQRIVNKQLKESKFNSIKVITQIFKCRALLPRYNGKVLRDKPEYVGQLDTTFLADQLEQLAILWQGDNRFLFVFVFFLVKHGCNREILTDPVTLRHTHCRLGYFTIM